MTLAILSNGISQTSHLMSCCDPAEAVFFIGTEDFKGLKEDRKPAFLDCDITGLTSGAPTTLRIGRPLLSISLLACFLKEKIQKLIERSQTGKVIYQRMT